MRWEPQSPLRAESAGLGSSHAGSGRSRAGSDGSVQHVAQAGDHFDGMSAEVVQKYPYLPEMGAVSRQRIWTSRIVLNAEQA